jgi:hypothetical protein
MHYAYILVAQTFTAISMIVLVCGIEWSVVSRHEARKIIKEIL